LVFVFLGAAIAGEQAATYPSGIHRNEYNDIRHNGSTNTCPEFMHLFVILLVIACFLNN
jgi:hypothetical protein